MNRNRQLLNNSAANQQQSINQFQGFNPRNIINQIQNDPNILNNLPPQKRGMVQNVLNMLNNNDSQGLNEMANNMFKNQGMDFNEYANGLKQQLNLK